MGENTEAEQKNTEQTEQTPETAGQLEALQQTITESAAEIAQLKKQVQELTKQNTLLILKASQEQQTAESILSGFSKYKKED